MPAVAELGKVITCDCDFMCLVCLCFRTLKGKRLEPSTPDLRELRVHGSCSACIDPESNVKVTWL